MEVFNSSYTAEQLEYALSAVPSIGENGNWWIGDTDTGVYAGGVDVTGAEIGQTIKVAAVDENGRPTAWEAADIGKWEHICDITTTEEVASIEVTENADGVPLSELKYNEIWVVAKMVGASANAGTWWYCTALTDLENVNSPGTAGGGTSGTKYVSWYMFIRGNKCYANNSSDHSAYGSSKVGNIAWLGNLLDYYNPDHYTSLKFSVHNDGTIGVDTEIRIMGRRA